MNETNLIIQNRLREATVSLERANLIICDETWKCDSSVPPFSSIDFVSGTVIPPPIPEAISFFGLVKCRRFGVSVGWAVVT